jgi:F-type H+-transporting ATPase subunit epsilon
VADTLALEILTPSKRVFAGEVRSLGVMTSRGRIEVHPGHARMVSVLAIGVAHLEFPGNYGFGIAIHGGILRVEPPGEGGGEAAPGRIGILAREGEHPEEIDIERAERARDRAEEILKAVPGEPDEAARVLQDHLRAEARIGAFRSFKRPEEESGN